MIEAAETGFGASGRSTGLVNAGLWVMPSALKERLGPLYGDRLLNLLRDSHAPSSRLSTSTTCSAS